MGCGTPNRSELELRLNEFVNYLVVSEFKGSQYTEKIRSAYNNNENSRLTETLVFLTGSRNNIRNNPYQSETINLQNYVRSRSKSEQILIAFSLLFLSKNTAESLKTNFSLLKETFKSEITNFSNLDHLKEVLRFYFRFISAEVLDAYKNRTPAISSRELVQVQEHENYYSEAIIDDYMKKSTGNLFIEFDLERFFTEKIDYLQHENVRDELKHHYFGSPLFGKRLPVKPTPVNNLVSSNRPINFIPTTPAVNFQVPPQETSTKYYTRSEYTTNNPNETLKNSFTNSLPSQENYVPNVVSSNPPLISRPPISYPVQQQNYQPLLNPKDLPSLNPTTPVTNNLVLYRNPGNLRVIRPETVLNMRESALRYHNEIRLEHSGQNLERHEELEALAQNWAETLASNETIRNSAMVWNGLSVGENVAFADFDGCDAKLVLKSWYDQRTQFNYSLNQLQRNCGAFTQMVWRNSRLFGLGIAQSKSGQVYFVANYFPAGNIRDEFSENVKPVSFRANQ